MNSALSAFMVTRKRSGQMEMRPRVQERGQLQQMGAADALGKMSLLRETLLHEQNESITTEKWAEEGPPQVPSPLWTTKDLPFLTC